MEQLLGAHHHPRPALSPRTPTRPHLLQHIPSNRFRDHHHPHPHALLKILRITPPLFLLLLGAVYLLASFTILSAPAPSLRPPRNPSKLIFPMAAPSSSSYLPASPKLFELDNGRIRAKITNVGATVTSLLVPDKSGVLADVVLGFDSLDPYLNGTSPYFGCIVGRVANRIKDGKFTLHGVQYSLATNNPPNSLHGDAIVTACSGTSCSIPSFVSGYENNQLSKLFLFILSLLLLVYQSSRIQLRSSQSDAPLYPDRSGFSGLNDDNLGGYKGFDKVIWEVAEYNKGKSPSITFKYESKDGEEGYPGDVSVTARYSLAPSTTTLKLEMEAVPLNKATPINLAQHTYWNLAGHNSGDVLGHSVQIWASQITPVDETSIPTGELMPVSGTPFDFLGEAEIGGRIGEVPGGYDHNYVLDGGEVKSGLRHVARVTDPRSLRVLDVWADAPGVQFYTGNFLHGVSGKGGAVYGKHGGLCLETQGFPNAVNQPNFPSVVVRPGEKYTHTMLFEFSTK